jgi:DNA-binding SARP family transcriptional activator
MLITLVDRIASMGARCVRVVAGAGWGKSAFARIYATLTPNAAIVDCRGMLTLADFEAGILDALAVTGADTRAGYAAAWAAAGPPSTVIIDGISRIINVEHAVDAMRTLLRTLPAQRNVVLCCRFELPIVWSTYFAPHEIAAIGAADLAIDRSELELLVAGTERAPGLDERILSVSQGWPIAVLLFVRLAAAGRLEAALDKLGDAATFGDLHAYVQAEIFDALGEGELETLCAVVALGGATPEDVSLALGRDTEDELDGLSGRPRYLLSRRPDVALYDALPLAGAAAENLQRDRIRAIMRSGIGRFRAAGRHVRAAELALQLGDDATAVVCLDDAAAPVPGYVPGAAYLRAALAIDVDHLARSHNVLTILLAGHYAPAARRELAAKVEARWRERDAGGNDAGRRAVLRIARAYLLAASSEFEAARRNANLAERDAGALPAGAPIVRALHVMLATLAANFGDLGQSTRAWAASGEPLDPGETFFAAQRIECSIFTAIASADTNTIAHAYMAALDVVGSWRNELGAYLARMCGAGLRYHTTGQFPDAVLAGDANAERADTDPAAHGMILGTDRFDRATRFTALGMIGAALAQSDPDVALDVLKSATELADAMRLPMPRVLARVVAAAVNAGPERTQLLDEAAALASGPLRERVAELRAGTIDDASLFRPFLRGPAAWNKTAAGPACRIEIMRGHVICHGEVVRLRGREHELLVAIALANGALSRDALLERLWPQQDEQIAAGSLRSTLHRLRQQLRDVQLVTRDGNIYRLSPDVSVDVTEAEVLYNVLRREAAKLTGFERGRLERQFQALAYGVPDAYTRWAWFSGAETRLVDLRHGIGMLLAREDFRTGDYASAMRWTEQLIELDPLDEVAAELHFQSLVRSGGRTEAARWLRRYRDLLAREYGMEPSFELDRAAGDELSASA